MPIHMEQNTLYTDPLTGLGDIRCLYKDYEDTDLNGVHFIYVDIDDFNKMNIIFGVDTVEDMLINVGKTLVDYCGKSDVYRVGNDQFLLLTKSHIICEPAELQTILQQPFKHHKIQYVINASVCVADYDDFKGDTLKEMINMLRITVDLTKNQGRNTLIYANKEHKDHYTLIKEIETNIYDSMKKNQFFPKYRPFVDTFTYEIIGFESVSRWELNDRELKPHQFLEIAQWTGLVYDIELFIFDEAMKFFRQLLDDKSIKLSKRFKAGVNLSEYTLITIEISTIIDILKKYDISAKDVILEIKESYITDKNVYQKVHNLYELGFVLVLDDYSNTTTSLTYLADLHVDALKLSETLLDEVNNSEQFTHMKSVYKFFVDISQKFEFTVVSTGIKTKRDKDLVKELGVNIATGDYFSRAIVKDEFVQYLKLSKKRKNRL